MEQTVQTPPMQRLDRRTTRTRAALREALAAEVVATGDLTKVTVTAVADRAGVTRRTFYSHYRDIPDLVACVEEEALCDLRRLVREIAQVTLPELEEAIHQFEPCPRSVEVLTYFQGEGAHLVPLLGDGGDPAFAEKLKAMVREVVHERAAEGFFPLALAVHLRLLPHLCHLGRGGRARALAHHRHAGDARDHGPHDDRPHVRAPRRPLRPPHRL